MRFLDQTVVVTGGGQGIGRAIARDFAREGAVVFIADIDPEAGAENRDYIQENGGRAFLIRSDVAEAADVKALYAGVEKETGRVNILVNNAGISRKESLFNDSTALWSRVLAVNLGGAYLCSKYAAPLMRKAGGGAIVNIASTRALMSEPDSEAYAASKGGILALTHALAVSLGPHRIRVNAICPGWIEVSDWKKGSLAKAPLHSDADRDQHPVGRVGRPEDISAACLYLCSEEAGFITGTHLVIDGGMTVKMIYAE